MNITEKCTGCMACYNACPFNAIEIIQNEKGFYEPHIIEEKCKKCKKCVITCPQNNLAEKKENKVVYAAWSNSEIEREESTSGGIFSEIAKKVLEEDGIVVGAIYDENFKVVHGILTNKEDLQKTRGSKYVQSYIGDSFKIVKKYLDEGRKVLFSGVACQIAGLKNFLNKKYNNLITVDVLCHGVPSPMIFEEYKKRHNGNEISNIKFRYKKPSWTIFSMKIDYKNGSSYSNTTYKDEYIRAFLEDYITNEVCCECKYTGKDRVSDITLADFWGYISESFKNRNTEKGISLVIVNTKVVEEYFYKIKERIVYIEKTFEEAAKGNQCLRKPFQKNKLYNEFCKNYFLAGYDDTVKKYIREKNMPLKRKISLIFNDTAWIFPKEIREKLIKIRDKK